MCYLTDDAWDDEVKHHELSDDDAERLRDALVIFVKNNFDHNNHPSAVWALGKLADPSTLSPLREVLEKIVQEDNGALYQTLIALDNLGEEVFPTGSSSINDGNNRKIAIEYLDKVEKSG